MPTLNAEPCGPASSIGVAALALLGFLVAIPRIVRRCRREHRLGEGPELVWLEFHDTVVDLWLSWPAGRSPREAGAHLVQFLLMSEDADRDERPRPNPGCVSAGRRLGASRVHDRA